MGRAHYRPSSGRASHACEGEVFFTSQRSIRVGLQGPAARILEPIRNHNREGGTCSRATVARLDRDRCLEIHPARKHYHPEEVFCPKQKKFPFVRLQLYYE